MDQSNSLTPTKLLDPLVMLPLDAVHAVMYWIVSEPILNKSTLELVL